MSDVSTALDLMWEGFFVFPCKRDKTPYTEHGYKDAKTDFDQIHKWWKRWPKANVGVDCGRSGLVVLDIDDQNIAELIKFNHPTWMDTRRVRTGSGGLHLYYKIPYGFSIKSKNRCIAELPSVDVKSEGGYVIAAGSNEKGSYVLEDPREPSKMPGDLLVMLIQNNVAVNIKSSQDRGEKPRRDARQNSQDATGEQLEASARHYLEEAISKAHRGNRNEVGFWLAGQVAALTRAGYSERDCERIMLEYQRQVDTSRNPYKESEAMASLRSALRFPREPALVNGKKERKKDPDKKASNQPAPDDEVSEELKEAMKIFREGKPIDFIMEVFHKDYVGGEEYGRLLILSSLCGTCNNTSGLHPGVEGESGEGKSFAMKTVINLLPPEYVVNGSISPKALFYNDVKPGSVVYLDDIGNMPEDLAQVIKIATSKYQEGTSHLSTFNGKGTKRNLQKCLNWWINGVDAGSFDIQILNRNVNVSLGNQSITARKEHKEDVFLHQLKDAMSGRPANIVTPEVMICREIFRHLMKKSQINVTIPWLGDENGESLITWNDINNSRNFPIFMDMIRVSTSIHRYQRKRDQESRVIADIEDFDVALRIWNSVSKEQVSKLNHADQEILQAMMDLKAYEKPVDREVLAKKIKKSEKTVYERLHGRKLDGIKGLLDRDHRVQEIRQTETKYDVEIQGEDQFEKDVKTGAVGRQRYYYKLTEPIDLLKMSLEVVSLDREKVKMQLEKIYNNL